MAFNTMAYVPIFQQALDEQLVIKATTGWMAENAGQVIYSGGNEVKIPSITTQGLADYDREEGFTKGAVNLSFQTHTFTQDRGRTFSLDRMDVDESGFASEAAAVLSTFQETEAIPEIDSYRYSKLYSLLAAKGRINTTGYTPASATIFSQLLNDIYEVQEAIGENIPLVISMSYTAAQQLDFADSVAKILDVSDFKRGEINIKTKSIDGYPIFRIPSARFKTAYTSYDGKSPGQEGGGLVPVEGAKEINWIIVPLKAPIVVAKTEALRIFQPDSNQNADAWKIDYRVYHDLWLKESAYPGCKANVGV